MLTFTQRLLPRLPDGLAGNVNLTRRRTFLPTLSPVLFMWQVSSTAPFLGLAVGPQPTRLAEDFYVKLMASRGA
jgi:hypothetical protein